MRKRIWLNDTEIRQVYITYGDNKEYWNCEGCKNDVHRIAEYLKSQGYDINQVVDEDDEQYIEVNRSVHDFKGKRYLLNQCDGDVFEWFRNATIGDFTYYFDKLIFNTEDGFVAAYRDDINNNCKI